MFATMEEQFTGLVATLIAYIPQLAGGLALIVAGWLLARLLRVLATRFLTTLNRLLDRLLHGATLDFVRISPATARLLGSIVFWVTLLIFITMAIRVMGLTGAAAWLEALVTHLPAVAAGIAIMATSLIAGTVVRNLVLHAAASAGLAKAPLYGHVAQISTIVIGLVIGLDQVGVDVTFLILLLGIVLGTLLLGFALAFALGARDLVSNLVATQHLRLFVKPGQVARIGDFEGRVLEFAPTGLVLETLEGRALVPGSLCLHGVITVLSPVQDDDQP